MFIDRVKIFVRGGKGGDGVVSFRREKYVPRGGPDGGDGGDGGDVILVATDRKNTLIDFSFRPHLRAPDGGRGGSKNKRGESASPLVVEVPVGTVIKDENGAQLADLCKKGMKAVVVRGGRGGLGNARFATSRRRTPDFALKGEPGEERVLILELKLLADVGLVGFPNAGKSTFLARVSAARPKIADFPFTTLTPHLGVVYLGQDRSFILADIPGLIEGAHKGAGLGHQFLRHIERTRLLLYLLDMAATEGRDPYSDYITLRNELGKYNPELLRRPSILVANKMDLPGATEKLKEFRAKVGEAERVFSISALTGEGTGPLLEEIYRCLQKIPHPLQETPSPEGEVIYLPPLKHRELSVQKEGDLFIVSGDEVEKAVRGADLNNPEGLRRFHQTMEKLGVEEKLLKMGIKEGDTVRFGELEFTYFVDSY